MTDSPAKSAEAKPVEAKAEAKTVPIQRLSEVVGQKNELKTENESLKKELETAKQANPNLDMEAFLKAVAEVVSVQTEAAVQRHVQPLRAKAETAEFALANGLNEKQLEAVAKAKDELGLPWEKAIRVARSEAPDLFAKQETKQRPFFGSALGASGDSPLRQAEPKEDFVAKMREAAAAGHTGVATDFAVKEFARRLFPYNPLATRD